jgi:hypothetical protein
MSTQGPITNRAETEAQILRYWKAVELFSPQKTPRLNPNNRTQPVLRTSGETPLPWDPSHWFPAPDSGRKWRFTAHCGVYKLSRVRAFLEEKFGRDKTSFDRRPDGESCLFAVQVTAEGRPLLDTFVLASCPWAVGSLRARGPAADWSSGFEAAAAEEQHRFAERFALREDDEIGRNLNRNSRIRIGRPIQPHDLEAEVKHIADSLGIGSILHPREVRLAARQVHEKYELEAESDDFLNSFFLRDLDRVGHEAAQSNTSSALSRFLSPDEDVHPELRCDVRTSMDALWRNTAPRLAPPGRWPMSSAQPLYFSQQHAVNIALESFANNTTPIFAVNGPPGTGKTTLFRDVIAAVLVNRARILAGLDHPELAFKSRPAHWKTAGYQRSISLWREDLLGFEIVVASSNNRAVENVTLEIPAKRAIGREFSKIDYFADFATRLLSEDDSDGKEQPAEAWGLIAARLGNKKNRRKFINRFWFADKKAREPRTRPQNGFQKYLQCLETGKRNPAAWKQAVAAFETAVKREAAIRKQRITAWDALESERRIRQDLAATKEKLDSATVSAADARKSLKLAEDLERRAKLNLDEARTARREHQDLKPGLVDAVFTRGAAYREWTEKDRSLAVAASVAEEEWKHARGECDTRRKELSRCDEEVGGLMADLARQQDMLRQCRQTVDAFRERLGEAFPDIENWARNPDERERSSPWADKTWNEARTQVLLAALYLHRAFIECVPKQIRKNLHGAMDILSGKVWASPGGNEALQSAWATLFFVIPVVSTTFASFDRLFSHCGRESLGWLLIDEAGQATVQSAAGALWRSQRAIIVGDPLQLEPIVSLPFTAQQALRAHFGVDETWLPSGNSVQTLADRVTHFGTWIGSEEPDRRIWVGSPLRVHRRCEKTIFNISNEIAYSGQMVYATEELPSMLPPSTWIDVAALESDDHWIPEEGLILNGFLNDLYRSGVRPANLLLISPFRAVARKLREIAGRRGIRQAGTIHVSQGKESDIVVLVLGGDPRRPGAKQWASEKPNLLNVAVSRAKRRIYIIGNRDEWSEYPNFSDASALLGKEEAIRARGAGHFR